MCNEKYFNFFQKLLKFEGQFDLDGQGQGHQFLNSPETCMNSTLKFKFKMVQKLSRPQKIPKFLKFVLQSDLRGQGYQFENLSESNLEV